MNWHDEGSKIVRVASASKRSSSSHMELTSNSPDDPGHAKRWGFISAQPSEYLIAFRRGKLREQVSGQGGRCFKRPSDTVAIIPTTLKEVVFQANQITVDNVDVRLRGMVIYRIVDPCRVYRLINFTSRQGGEAKLARMVADMCRSTSKWLVANMDVSDCVRRRKEDIARQLKSEVATVVSSAGPHGWGVEIVTIDIQDIFIQDEELFQALQAKFKAEQEREARLARLEAAREVKRREIELERELDRERHDQAREREKMETELRREKIFMEQECDEEQFRLDRFRVEKNEGIALLKVEEAQRRRRFQAEEEQKIERLKTEAEEERERVRTEGARERAEIQAETQRLLNEEEARAFRERLDAESAAGPASLERMFVDRALPKLAETMAESMRGAKFSVFQNAGGDSSGTSPFHFAMHEVLDFLGARKGGNGAAAGR